MKNFNPEMDNERELNIKKSIFESAHALLNTLSTSLGPKGLDKMIIKNNKTTVTNDGATILKFFTEHPIHAILSNLSSSQDDKCGDGTTSVVILTCSLLNSVRKLVELNIHPSIICEHLERCKKIATNYIEWAKIPINNVNLFNTVITTLNSKIVGNAVEMASASIKAMDSADYDKKKVRILKRIGGSIDDVMYYNGMLFQSDIKTESKNVKVGVIQFCISAPKTNMDSKILVNNPELMEKMISDERKYILDICKKIKVSGCQLLIIQKNILRDSLSDLGRHFLKQLNILVIERVDRKEIEYICDALKIEPISDVNFMTSDNLRDVEIKNTEDMLEIKGYGSSIVLNGCDDLVLDEVERSLNDALCVVKCLHDEPFIIPGGGAVEMAISNKILESEEGNIFINREISRGFEAIPYFLARNAGLNPIDAVSELKKVIQESPTYGISVRGNNINDMLEDDNVVQPVSISKSIVNLAIETVIYLLKIDDILPSRGN